MLSVFGNKLFKGSGTLCRSENGQIFLMTAAHNVVQVFDDLEFKAERADRVYFDLGKNDTHTRLVRLNVVQMWCHPSYIRNSHFGKGYDIAIGKLYI